MCKYKLRKVIFPIYAMAILLLFGCDRQLNHINKRSSHTSLLQKNGSTPIDWEYAEAIKNSERFTDDALIFARQALDARKSSPNFHRLVLELSKFSRSDFIVCETYSPCWGSYSFVLLAPDPLDSANLVGYVCSEGEMTKLESDTPFQKVKAIIDNSGIFIVAPNLENLSMVDDGEFYFYTFKFQGHIKQTLCYAPIELEPVEVLVSSPDLSKAFGKTYGFYVVKECMLALLNLSPECPPQKSQMPPKN